MTGLADRVVRGAVAFMAAATVAATVTGFWLSYDGLHQFALRAGLRAQEAWAWPASVDLFILAGELGITIAAVSRKRDPMAWVYLLAGFGPSVAFNVLHVAAFTVPWARYAVAAVPPVAAMLALAALMRQVYRLAVEAHSAAESEACESTPESTPEAAPREHPESTAERAPHDHPEGAPGRAADGAPGAPVRSTRRAAAPGAPRRARPAPVSDLDAEAAFAGLIASGAVPGKRQIRRELHVGDKAADRLHEHLTRVAAASARGGELSNGKPAHTPG